MYNRIMNWVDWDAWIFQEQKQLYFQQLLQKLQLEYAQNVIYPPYEQIFRAFELTPLNQIKVVILGQDPYHGKDQAHGLAFSVQKGVALPKSLINIYKELQSDLQIPMAKHGDLTYWAKQGVFLLNSCLTVKEGQANSHRFLNWDKFTDRVIELISLQQEHVVFILWGKYAHHKRELIHGNGHLILEASHPSPLSAYHGFFGCRHFSKTNIFLRKWGMEQIDWNVENEKN